MINARPGTLGLILVANAVEAKVGSVLSAPWFTCRTLTQLFFYSVYIKTVHETAKKKTL